MLVTKDHIKEYIPQGDPIVMIDGILKADFDSIVSVFTPQASNIFCSNGYFTESGLIENMAQTAAAKAGLRIKGAGNKPLLGFIGSIKNLKIYNLPPVGATFETHLRITGEVMNVNLASAYVLLNGERLAECEFKIFEQLKA